MASLIQSYEYDIFISYRQKDNKHDGWVTEFVDNLKGELESTFKEEISVYFDINPHDGLLETHDVDASLKEKLKCLIFIPIISRTYCDPKSFAWEHEFKAFIDQTSRDQYGLKVKLPNGNVATRILPIQIHDLHPEDKSLLERELGSVLRAIEFIYKEPGVNKPLSEDDDEKKNLNGTKYRIQINKVSNAIDEIIHSLKGRQPISVKQKLLSEQPYVHIEEDIIEESIGSILTTKKTKRWHIALAAVLFCIVGAFALFKFNSAGKRVKDIAELEKSIAVLPFINDSPDQENAYFINGIMEEILNNLQKIKDFRVLSRSSTEQYRGTARPTIIEMAKKLDVNYIIEGSGQKYGNKFRFRVQLITARNENHIWGESYEKEIKETSDIFQIQSQIANSIAGELEATITPDEKQLIEKSPTSNLTAYYYYQKGQEEQSHTRWPLYIPERAQNAEVFYRKAVEYDSTFALAYGALAELYWLKCGHNFSVNYKDSILILANMALSYDNRLAQAYYTKGGYYDIIGDYKKAIEEWDITTRYNPNYWEAYRMKGNRYEASDLIKAIENMEKAVSLNHGPELPQCLENLGELYCLAGFPEKGKDYFLKSLKLDGDSIFYLGRLAFAASINGDYDSSFAYHKRRYLKDSSNSQIMNVLGYYYLRNGKYKESLKFYKKYLLALAFEKQSMTNNDYHIGYAFLKNGLTKEAENYFDKGLEYYNNLIKSSISIDEYALACFYSCKRDKENTFKYLKIYSQTHYGTLYGGIIVKREPAFENIRNEPEFQSIVKNVETKWNAEHERVRKWLEERGEL